MSDEIENLRDLIRFPMDKNLRAEVVDAQWSDFGRLVSQRIFDPEFVHVVTRAALKAKTTLEHTAMIRAFLLTGARP